MKYQNGIEARLGDRVKLLNGDTGTIVFSADTNEYSEEYPEKQWRYVKEGVMIETDNGALVRCSNTDQLRPID